MADKPPQSRNVPSSPDELGGGLRGPVSGVTRIGPRAFGLAFLVICGLLIAILYGLNRSNPNNRTVVESFASAPPAPSTNEPRFAQNEPIVPSAAPATAPPPLYLQPTSVPNLDNADNSKIAAQAAPVAAPPAAVAPPSGPSPEEQRAAADRAAREQARLAAENARRERIRAALHSAILAGTSTNQADGVQNGGATAGAMQVAFAGNGDTGAPVRDASNVGDGAAASGSGSGNGRATATGFESRRTADAAASSGARASSNYLDGPSGQYAVQGSDVVLPQGGNPKDFLQAQRFAPISPYEIVASSVIPAALITGIDSELQGLLSAQVREDVYDSKTGRYLLIPKGSRLVGLYKNDVSYGQTRVLVAWQRLIFPDTTSIDLLNMSGADVEGGAGVAGTVDNHYGKIFGAALLTSILAAGLQLAQPPQSQNVLQAPSAGQTVSQAVGTTIAQTGTEIVRKDLNIPPTLHVPKGYPFLVVVDRDIVLPGPYRASR